MKILTWNVNGLRAIARKGDFDFLLNCSADIICLQETKSSPEQLDDSVRNINGYHSFFSSSTVKKGYSGTAIYSKIKPNKVNYNLGISEFDTEGRVIEVHFDDFILFNVYFPNGGAGNKRVPFKLEFYEAFLNHIELLRKKGKKIIFCGDVNTAHNEIDLARPKENQKNTGFLPVERAWIDKLVGVGYLDVFRYFNPNKTDAYTYWDMKTRARDRNVGWRIDYFFVSANLQKNLKNIDILSDVYGSDHAPVVLTLK